MRRLVLAALSLAFLAACQPAATELTDEQKAAIGDSITAVHNDMWQTWMARDLDGTMLYFLDSPDVGFGSSGGMYYGFENLTAVFESELDGVTSVDFSAAQRRVDVLSWDVVCVRELGTYSATYAAGATVQVDDYALTTIWVRRDGEWKILHMHDSYTEPESGE